MKELYCTKNILNVYSTKRLHVEVSWTVNIRQGKIRTVKKIKKIREYYCVIPLKNLTTQ